MNPHSNRWMGADRGSMAIEMVIIAPVMLLLLTFMIMAGRVYVAKQSVDDVAMDAARTASLQRDAGTAQAAATGTAHIVLAESGLECTSLTVSIDTGGFSVPVGQAADVVATVVCQADLDGLVLPGAPGGITLTGTGISVIDTYRER